MWSLLRHVPFDLFESTILLGWPSTCTHFGTSDTNFVGTPMICIRTPMICICTPMTRLLHAYGTPIHANETRARRVKRACMWKATLICIFTPMICICTPMACILTPMKLVPGVPKVRACGRLPLRVRFSRNMYDMIEMLFFENIIHMTSKRIWNIPKLALI